MAALGSLPLPVPFSSLLTWEEGEVCGPPFLNFRLEEADAYEAMGDSAFLLCFFFNGCTLVMYDKLFLFWHVGSHI